ncbi:MAG: hypothetical protein H7061_02265 [Bdellovibrionaceae bacterium]|nr:hypothetical protein [Bdellovibrio sp.]
MFYSQKSKIIDHNLTYLHSQKVFTGQYWDEFALTSSLVPDNAEVLMLGLSLGGGIRPILSGDKIISLTCVDYDSPSVNKCKSFYKEYFPEIKFKAITEDAKIYLSQCSKKFHAIWLDIYEAEAYSSLYFEQDFMNLIKSSLENGGVLLVNSYGLPNHFSPLELDGVQNHLAKFLAANFESLRSIPFRRNITFVASNAPAKIYETQPQAALNAMDKFTFKFIQQKLQASASQEITFNTESSAPTVKEYKFGEIDNQMRAQWQELRNLIKPIGISLNENKEIVMLLENQTQCAKALKHLLDINPRLACFVPILGAGESHSQALDIGWIFDWTYNNIALLKEKLNEDFGDIWLCQLWSLVIHPNGQFKAEYFKMLEML